MREHFRAFYALLDAIFCIKEISMQPAIGIRPIIDGRWGGIREGLEEQTRRMAHAAKKLIESNLFYTDGTKVRVVVFDGTIGGGAEAAKCREFFETQNVVEIGRAHV